MLEPVTLTARAADEVRKIMRLKSIPAHYGLRIGAQGGKGCGGSRLIIGFDRKKSSDLSYEAAGIPILVDKKHTLYVIGKVVEYYEGADGSGFIFADKPVEQKNSGNPY